MQLEELLDMKDQVFADEDEAWTAIGYSLDLNHPEFNKLLRDWKVSNKTREASLNTLNMLHLFENQDYDLWNIYKLGVDNFERTLNLAHFFGLNLISKLCEKKLLKYPLKVVMI
jgi:hypothetical protein